MSSQLFRSRISLQLSRTTTTAINNGFHSNNSLNNCSLRLFCTKESPLSSSSSSSSSPNNPSSSAPPPPPPLQKKHGFVAALKFVLVGAFTGVTAAVGYATSAYTVEEVDEKTKAFRASANYPLEDDASSIKKIQARVRSAVVTGPAKAIELYLDLRRSIEEHVRNFTEPSSDKLLPDLPPNLQNVFTLVLDLNETLVHSDWKRDRGWRTFKRPGVDAFLEHLSQYYEIVVYSDNLNMYVDPVVERLNDKHYISYHLSRSATRYKDGIHYRDLSKLNRDPSKIIYVSGHALENCLQPENCVQMKPWSSDDMTDTSLVDLIPFLEFVARSGPRDIRKVLESYQGRDIAKEFIERSKEHQRRMQEKKPQGHFWRF